MMDNRSTGVLNVLKPAGLTSHDVVARIRRLFRQKRVGHAGTLDPAARGVLLVGLGQATRVLEYLGELPKTYRARIVLGIATDTHDSEGKVTRTAAWEHVTWPMLRQALTAFVGNITQVPPMYAAIKQDGRPLYALARQGITVDRKARPVQIHALTVLAWHPPYIDLEIVCSRGTYIRSLARDLGDAVDSVACLASLVRTAIGTHDLRRAVSLGALQALGRGFAQRRVMSMGDALCHLPSVRVSEEQASMIGHGRSIELTAAAPGEPALAVDSQGNAIAILGRDASQRWHPDKVFAPPTRSSM